MAVPTTYLYKILDDKPPSPLPETLPVTGLDAQDGYIHLSAAWRVATTASKYFNQCGKLWLLQLRIKDLDGELKYPHEQPGCAHVHNSRTGLGSTNVHSIIEVDKNGRPDWAAVTEIQNLED